MQSHLSPSLSKTLLALSTLAFSPYALAGSEKPLGLTGSGEAGYNLNTGNTESEVVHAAIKLNYLQADYELKGLFEAKYKEEQEVQTAERYVMSIKGDLFFTDTPKMFGFSQLRLERDQFSSIDLTSYVILGAGYNFVKTQTRLLSAEFGMGLHQTDYTPGTADDDFSQLTSKSAFDYKTPLNENVSFEQDATLYYGSHNYKVETNTGLKIKLSTKSTKNELSLKASIKLRYMDKPAQGAQQSDTETRLVVMYSF